jgi:hypothetical protein
VRDSFVTCVIKTSLFQAIFEILSTFLIFLWIVECIIVVADVNTHLSTNKVMDIECNSHVTNNVTCMVQTYFLLKKNVDEGK